MIELEAIFILSAFFAGLLMFLAPCTLPLLPAYLGFISGITERELHSDKGGKLARKKVLTSSLMFVFGFSLVFIFLGMLAGLFGSVVAPLTGKVFPVLGGVLIIFFGLFLIGTVHSAFLTKERRITLPKNFSIGSKTSSFLLGSAFALGWTPCMGPVYGTILIFVSTTSTALTGAFLLFVFSLGFSIPFVLFALLISQSTRILEKATPFLRIVSVLGGVALVIIGISVVFGDSALTRWFFSIFDFLDVEHLLLPHL